MIVTLPLSSSLESRDGVSDKDQRLMNAMIEATDGQAAVLKRPGVSSMGSVSSEQQARLLASANGDTKAVVGDSFIEIDATGTTASVTASTTMNAIETFADCHAEASISGALFIKNGKEAWVYTK